MNLISRPIQLIATALCLALPHAAPAQPFPSKPIRIVAEFIPGSGGDTITRIMASPLSEILGQPVVVDNRPGAGGLVAADLVAKAAPDGYTLVSLSPNVPLMRQFMVKNNTFDALRDLTPITLAVPATIMLVANPSVPVNSFRELIDYAKRNPGKLSYGTSGIGSAHHLSGEELKMLTGVEMVHVPYKGTQQALLDVVAGQLPLTYILIGQAMPFIRSGKVKVLAAVDDARSPLLPEVPAVKEIVPGFEAPPGWLGIFGPANLPPPILARLNTDMVKALTSSQTRARLREGGSEVGANSPEEFVALIKAQSSLLARIVKAAGIQSE